MTKPHPLCVVATNVLESVQNEAADGSMQMNEFLADVRQHFWLTDTCNQADGQFAGEILEFAYSSAVEAATKSLTRGQCGSIAES